MWTHIKFLVVALVLVGTLALAVNVPVSASALTLEDGLAFEVETVSKPIIRDPIPLPRPTPPSLPSENIIIVIPDSVVASCGSDGNTLSCLQRFCDAQRAGDVQAMGSGYVCVSR